MMQVPIISIRRYVCIYVLSNGYVLNVYQLVNILKFA